MRIIAGYIWGIWWWRTSDPTTRIADQTCKLRTLDGCRDGMSLLRAAGVDELRLAGIRRGIPRFVPLEIVTNDRVGHAPSKSLIRHAGRGEVPSGSLCQIGDGLFVFSPSYCVLQIASIAVRLVSPEVEARFAVVVVAKVASEMCGQYTIVGNGGIRQRTPLVTVGELAALSLEIQGVSGAALLRKVIPWVVANTRSPKETDLCLLLVLPAEFGGYGLPRPLSNFDIDVRRVRSGFFAGWKKCNVDLYWGQAKLVVEYDSREFHEDQGCEKVNQDEARAAALRELGYTVITITRNELYSARQFRSKAAAIAEALAAELPKQTPEFEVANKTLRMMLLRHDPWV